jgi:fermentation-respiration switch protein FrsA (DUF1100 family)
MVCDLEVDDLEAVLVWAREVGGAAQIVCLGFSMGGAVVLRHAALAADGVVEAPSCIVVVSTPGSWSFPATPRMRTVNFAVGSRVGRWTLRNVFDTRMNDVAWPRPYPMSPIEAAEQIPPLPLLVVHGDRDIFFPVSHAEAIVAAAKAGAARRAVDDRTTVWIEHGVGHAEAATSAALVRRIGLWALDAASTGTVR